ncbi:MAG: hypothetical protein RBU37_03630 [Myxococcota bacterium]|jgi:hypothetical protein|nr:hypothetical protein [Myxococcota bacterium]
MPQAPVTTLTPVSPLPWLLCCALLFALSTSCDDTSVTPPGDQSEQEAIEELSDDDTVNEVELLDETEQTQLQVTARGFFDLDTALEGSGLDGNGFYDFPMPSALRTDELGYPNLEYMPAPAIALVKDAIALVQRERPGFSPLGASYFRFDAALDPASFPTPAQSLQSDAAVQLINIDEDSPRFGERIPVYVTFRENRSVFWVTNTLIVRPMPGLQMESKTRYAAVLLHGLRAADGGAVGAAPSFEALLQGEGPLASDYEDVFAQLEQAGIAREQLISATAFETSDVLSDFVALREAILEGPSPLVEGLQRADEGPSYVNYLGTFQSTEFFSGEAPYTQALGAGRFEFDAEGKPLNARQVPVRFALTVPRSPSPGKIPLVIYGHGTGGDYLTHADSNSEGAWLATVGLATLGFDAALHGERSNGVGDFEMLLLTNPVAAREVVRQTVVDMMVLYRLAREGAFTLDATVTGDKSLSFEQNRGLYMGHSQGSQEGALLLAIEQGIDAAFLSAGGGGVVLSILDRDYNGQPVACALAFVMGVKCSELTADHPSLNLVVQAIMDPADPLHFARHVIAEPLAGSRSKHLAMSEGTLDKETPPSTQEALAAALGLALIEPVAKTSDPLDFANAVRLAPPVQLNLDGNPGKVTGGLIQFAGEDHFAIYDRADARNRYIRFLESAASGTPVIVAPN